MKKLGIFVGESGLWKFFREIYEDLAIHYEATVFSPREYHVPVLSGRLNSWAYRNGIRSILKRSDACFFEWASELLEAATHMPKYCPIITRLHSFELEEWADRIEWNHVDKIILVSEAMRCRFEARYPAQARKTSVVYNAISTHQFKPIQRRFDFSIGMVGNILPVKRVYEMILVVKELRDEGAAATLHIAGGPSQGNPYDRYYVAVHRLAEKLGLQDSVRFYGNVDNVPAWLRNIDIFISNSFWEGMQTALLEAMASGCYCLGHFWDGVEEALPSENIYATDDELIRKLIAYTQLSEIERSRHRMLMVDIAREKFDIEDKESHFREIIESVQ